MKCPKCGFNSFEFHDNCKKCGVSLASFKTDLNIRPVIYSADRPSPVSVPSPSLETEAEFEFEKAGETFTWDTQETEEASPAADSNFSGFDLDFLKQDEKKDSVETEFSFGEDAEPEVFPAPAEENALELEDFSFYEETIEPAENQLFVGTGAEQAEEKTLFGETGVIGEILPEQLQSDVSELDLADIIDENTFEPGKYENEFDVGALSLETAATESDTRETKKDPLDFSDFEKDFESIFETGDSTSDNDKSGI